MPAMPAPAWAYKVWQLASWRNWRKLSWITLDEARRLGMD